MAFITPGRAAGRAGAGEQETQVSQQPQGGCTGKLWHCSDPNRSSCPAYPDLLQLAGAAGVHVAEGTVGSAPFSHQKEIRRPPSSHPKQAQAGKAPVQSVCPESHPGNEESCALHSVWATQLSHSDGHSRSSSPTPLSSKKWCQRRGHNDLEWGESILYQDTQAPPWPPHLHADNHSICRLFSSAQTQAEEEAAAQAHPALAHKRRSSSSRASPGHAANPTPSVQLETMPINCFAIHTKLLQYSLHRVVTRII